MSEKKRYYWLKLPNTYFSQLEQKKMRKQEHGKDMQIIYLRMMLYSLGRNGCIYYQNVYDTIEEELAEEFDEDVELIKETVKYLLDNNMISVEDSNISIPEVDRITGSECYSAERMRRMREKKKASQCDSGVTVSDASVTGGDEENRDQRLEGREESVEYRERDKESVLCDNFSPYSSLDMTEVNELFDKLWTMYPLKKHKEKVREYQRCVLYSIGLPEMVRAITRYLDSFKETPWKSMQYGYNFFNGGYKAFLDDNLEDNEEQQKKAYEASDDEQILAKNVPTDNNGAIADDNDDYDDDDGWEDPEVSYQKWLESKNVSVDNNGVNADNN